MGIGTQAGTNWFRNRRIKLLKDDFGPDILTPDRQERA
jgi:hypothetical protein